MTLIRTLAHCVTKNITNQRESWRARFARDKKIKTAVGSALLIIARTRPTLPVVVTLTRIAPRALDSDNLQASLKSARDTVAKWYGVDDGGTEIEWRYDQRRGRVREYAVEVAIAPRREQ